jgi:hypothetical protein
MSRETKTEVAIPLRGNEQKNKAVKCC